MDPGTSQSALKAVGPGVWSGMWHVALQSQASRISAEFEEHGHSFLCHASLEERPNAHCCYPRTRHLTRDTRDTLWHKSAQASATFSSASSSRPQSASSRPPSASSRPQSASSRPQSISSHPPSVSSHPPSASSRPQSISSRPSKRQLPPSKRQLPPTERQLPHPQSSRTPDTNAEASSQRLIGSGSAQRWRSAARMARWRVRPRATRAPLLRKL